MKLYGENYEFISDLHTHTIYSHGKGRVEDNIKAAAAKGLKTIGISDHGPAHIVFGVARKKFAEQKAEILALRRSYPEIEILFGVEANIIAPAGCLDIKPEEYEFFDYVCAGWHLGALNGMHPSGLTGWFGNFLHGKYHRAKSEQISNNTKAAVRALETGRVKFITHPGDNAPVDLLEIAAVCARVDTAIEINTHHMSLKAEDIQSMLLTDVKFIVNSDAHTPDRVGDFAIAAALIEASGLEPERIVNLRRI